MEAREAAEVLARAEEELRLLDYELDGWAVWPLFKFDIGMRLQGLRTDGGQAGGRRVQWTRAVRDVLALATVGHSRNLFIVYSSNRLEREGSKYKDIFFDDLIRSVGGVKLEHLDSEMFEASSRRAVVPSNLTTTACLVGYGLASRLGRPVKQIGEVAGPFASAVGSAVGAHMISVPEVEARLAHFHWLKRCYREILRRTRVKRMLLVTAYCDNAAVAAARELGIRVIELQHGFVDRNHYGYSWTAAALPYAEKMPIPDQVWLYGEYWREELEARGFWKEQLRVVGSPRVDQVRASVGRALSDHGTRSVVVTTQGIYTERLIEFLEEVLRQLGIADRVRIIIRLHPAEGRGERYVSAFSARSDVVVSPSTDELSTFQLIADAYCHVSISSTCHYEALAIGTPTIVLGFPTSENVRHLVDEGAASIAHSPEELVANIRSDRTEPLARSIGERYFAYDALQNMIREL
jgi:hypothetical protein